MFYFRANTQSDSFFIESKKYLGSDGSVVRAMIDAGVISLVESQDIEEISEIFEEEYEENCF